MFERATFNPSFTKKSRPQEAWRRIKLSDIEYVKFLHEYPLKYFDGIAMNDDEDGTWRCDGYGIFNTGCKSGQVSFALHEGTLAWRSTESDFDLCEMCLRWAIHCERKGKCDKLKV